MKYLSCKLLSVVLFSTVAARRKPYGKPGSFPGAKWPKPHKLRFCDLQKSEEKCSKFTAHCKWTKPVEGKDKGLCESLTCSDIDDVKRCGLKKDCEWKATTDVAGVCGDKKKEPVKCEEIDHLFKCWATRFTSKAAGGGLVCVWSKKDGCVPYVPPKTCEEAPNDKVCRADDTCFWSYSKKSCTKFVKPETCSDITVEKYEKMAVSLCHKEKCKWSREKKGCYKPPTIATCEDIGKSSHSWLAGFTCMRSTLGCVWTREGCKTKPDGCSGADSKAVCHSMFAKLKCHWADDSCNDKPSSCDEIEDGKVCTILSSDLNCIWNKSGCSKKPETCAEAEGFHTCMALRATLGCYWSDLKCNDKPKSCDDIGDYEKLCKYFSRSLKCHWKDDTCSDIPKIESCEDITKTTAGVFAFLTCNKSSFGCHWDWRRGCLKKAEKPKSCSAVTDKAICARIVIEKVTPSKTTGSHHRPPRPSHQRCSWIDEKCVDYKKPMVDYSIKLIKFCNRYPEKHCGKMLDKCTWNGEQCVVAV